MLLALAPSLSPYADFAYDLLVVFYVLSIVASIIVIISENRNPVKSLAWVTVLILLPIVGLVLYLFFGRSLKGRHLISRKGRRKLLAGALPQHVDAAQLPFTDETRQQVQLVNNLTGAQYFTGDRIEVFTSGQDKFDALKRDIEAATDHIHIQYYIYENDRIGREIRDLLIAKARQGVKVRLMYDHVGSFTINAGFFKRMRREGVEAHPFLELTLPKLANRLNWRNHRKVVVIDGKIGYIGGMNIADRYVTGDGKHAPWRDTHLRIVGPAVAALQYSFAVDWNFMSRDLLAETIPEFGQVDVTATEGMQIVPSGPTDLWSNISMVFIKAITLAKHTVLIQTPYFLPSEALLKALQSAALAGVDVRLMIPRNPDSLLLKLASGSYIKECLQSGIKVYFYEPAMMHSKLVLVDDEFVTTGSTNFDFRSFEHNFECNALIYSREFNRRMRAIFADDQRRCTRIILSHWRRRPVVTKALESLARLLSPIL